MFFNKYKQQYLHHTNALDSILKPIDIKYINHTPVAEVDNIGLFTPLPHTHHTHMPAGHSKHGRNYQIDEDPLQSPQTTETKEMGYRPLCSDRHAPSHKSPSGQCLWLIICSINSNIDVPKYMPNNGKLLLVSSNHNCACLLTYVGAYSSQYTNNGLQKKTYCHTSSFYNSSSLYLSMLTWVRL